MPAPPSASNKEEDDEPVPYFWYPDRDLSKKPERINIYRGLDHTILSLFTRVVVPCSAILAALYIRTGTLDLHSIYDGLYLRAALLLSLSEEHAPDILIGAVVVIVVGVILYLKHISRGDRRQPVYLVEFVTWQPPKEWEISVDWFCDRVNVPYFTKESAEFQQKISKRAGLGDRTAWTHSQQPKDSVQTMQQGRDETMTIFSTAVDELLAKTGIKPQEIDVLVVNCGLFNPTPSLASMMINKYKMRHNIRSFNLGGMGCSAGAISVDLAYEVLQNHKNCFALVLSTESVATKWYQGNDKAKLVGNTIFRAGGAAILLTNKRRVNAKYELECSVRVCTAASDDSYHAIYEDEDAEGKKGASLVSARHLLPVVSDAVRKNLTMLGPKVLPYTEQAKFVLSSVARSIFGKKRFPAYVPNFKTAFQHVCIHAGGKAIIDGMQKSLNLSDKDVEASRATLYRMGNTSASSIWYELYYIEQAHGVRKGEKVWQLALGGGVKCNSLVWTAKKNIPKLKTREGERK